MRGSFRAALLGGAAAALLGTGLISAVADSASSADNQVSTSRFDEQHDIKVAIVDNDTPCDSAAVVAAENVAAAQFVSPVDLDGNASITQELDNYCLYNAGSHTGEVLFTFQNVLETEMGCTGLEGESDLTCETGAPGEVTPLFGRAFAVQFGGTCAVEPSGSFTDAMGSGMKVALLAPGEYCMVYFALDGSQSTPLQRRVAQTDRLEWDIVFTIQDPPPGNEVEQPAP